MIKSAFTLLAICAGAPLFATSQDCNTMGKACVYVDKNYGDNSNNGSDWSHAYKDLYYAVGQAQNSGLDTIVHVAEGVYDEPSGEAFPIFMSQNVRIWGENAFSTIVRGSNSGSGFVFVEGAGPFGDSAATGPYLARLAIEDFSYGVDLTGSRGSGGLQVAPNLVDLVIRNNSYGIYLENAAPSVFDCTITANTRGIHKVVTQDPLDCTTLRVENCIVWGNLVEELHNIGASEISHSSFLPAKVTGNTLLCGYSAPTAVAQGVAPTAASNYNVAWDPEFYSPPFDLRLGTEFTEMSGQKHPGVRSIGIDLTSVHGLITDGEGKGNPRYTPYPQPSNPLVPVGTNQSGVSMGADQYDNMLMGPLAEFTHPDPMSNGHGMVGVVISSTASEVRMDGQPDFSMYLFGTGEDPDVSLDNGVPLGGWLGLWWLSGAAPQVGAGTIRPGGAEQPVTLSLTGSLPQAGRVGFQSANIGPSNQNHLSNLQDYLAVP